MPSALALCQVPCLPDLLQSGDPCRELRKSDSVIASNSLHLPDRSDKHSAGNTMKGKLFYAIY